MMDMADVSKTDMAEIDTSAPFESVKAALSMFGEGAFSPYKPNMRKSEQHSAEKAIARERQFLVARKELNKLKEQLKNCETSRAQVLMELERAKRVVDDLAHKLDAIRQSKESAVHVTEAEIAKLQKPQLEEIASSLHLETGALWKDELENAREQYAVAITELDAAKQELGRIKQDLKSANDVKATALLHQDEAEKMVDVNNERANHLSKEIEAVQESIDHVKSATAQANQEAAIVLSEKDTIMKSHKLTVEEAKNKLFIMKKEFDPDSSVCLEAKLAETTAQIRTVQKEVEDAKVSVLDSVKTVTTELDGAKGVLQKVAEEENSSRNLVDSLKLELESVQKEHLKLKKKEEETKSLAVSLHTEIQKSKAELENAIEVESKAREACDNLMSTLQQLTLESNYARKDVDAVNRNAAELKKESEATRISLDEAENRLHVTLKNAEAAKAAEEEAQNQIKILSEKAKAARSPTSESGTNITISLEKYESLSRMIEDFETVAKMRIATIMDEEEAVRSSENETIKKLEASGKEIEEIKLAIANALREEEMAENARKAVEGEIKRRREREQQKAAETASWSLTKTDISNSKKASPSPTRLPMQTPPHRGEGSKPQSPQEECKRKPMEKTPTIKKPNLKPSFAALFHRKKSSVVNNASPSNFPGEKAI